MNILKERRAFHRWLLLNEMNTSSIALWHALAEINNELGCQSTFNVPNSTLMRYTGLSKQGLINARKILIEKNLIGYKKGKRGKAPLYEMISLVQSFDLVIYQSSNQSLNQSHTKQLPIHREEEDRRGGGGGMATDEHVICMYEQNIDKLQPILQDELCKWCRKLGEAMVLEAIKLTVKKGGQTFGYLEKILNEWLDAGLKTVEQVGDYVRKRDNRGNNRPVSIREFKRNRDVFDRLLVEELQPNIGKKL